MQKNRIWKQFEALPPAAQRRVAELIALLSAGTKRSRTVSPSAIRKERFVGLWKNREDLADSTAWVRRLRREEWTR